VFEERLSVMESMPRGATEVLCVTAKSPLVVARDFAVGRWMGRTAGAAGGGEGEEGSQGNWALLGCECGELGVGRDTDCRKKKKKV
jgi:hypothetical protein